MWLFVANKDKWSCDQTCFGGGEHHLTTITDDEKLSDVTRAHIFKNVFTINLVQFTLPCFVLLTITLNESVFWV